MAKFKRDSWQEIQGMKDKVDRIINDMFDQPKRPARSDRAPVWQPVADVCETAREYVIQMEVPGVDTGKVELEVHGQELWVYGERRMEKDVTGSTYHILERAYGPFARRFLLSEEIDEGAIRAQLRNGLLTVIVPKKIAPGQVRKISIPIE